MLISRRNIFLGSAAIAAIASGWIHGGGVPAIPTTPFIQEITMAAPDIIRLEIRDPVIQRGFFQYLSSPDAGPNGVWASRTNPTNGLSDRCLPEGVNLNYLRFTDKQPTSYYNRTAGDIAGNWVITGKTVTNVYRKSWPYCEGQPVVASTTSNQTTFRHYVWLKLNSALVSGTTYAIIPPISTNLSSVSLPFNDKITRASSILVNQAGIRPVDDLKLGYLAQWIPGFGSEGVVNFSSTYSIGAFNVINASGTVVYSGGTFAQRVGPTDVEIGDNNTSGEFSATIAGTTLTVTAILAGGSTAIVPGGVIGANNANTVTANSIIQPYGTGGTSGTGGTGTYILSQASTIVSTTTMFCYCNRYFASSTQPVLTITAMTNANPGVFTCNNHGMSNGAIITLQGLGNGSNTLSIVDTCFVVQNVTTNTFTLAALTLPSGATGAAVDTTAIGTYTPGTFLTLAGCATKGCDTNNGNGFDSLLLQVHQMNRAGTYVYGLDFSAAAIAQMPTGTYKLQITGLGVSDPIYVSNGSWYLTAANSAKGMYNQIQGGVIDGRFGYIRGIALTDGSDGQQLFTSSMSMGFTSESGGYSGLSNLDEGLIGLAPFISSTRGPTGLGGAYHDSGDWPSLTYFHGLHFYNLLNYGYEFLPNASGQTTSFNFPQASSTWGGIYAGKTLPDVVNIALYFAEYYRLTQDVNGAVASGNSFGSYGFGDGGGSELKPSVANNDTFALSAPDHVANYVFSLVAAKLACIFFNLGQTTLSTTWQTAAVNAFNWAEGIFTGLQSDVHFYYDTTTYNGIALGTLANVQAYHIINNNSPNWTLANYTTAIGSYNSGTPGSSTGLQLNAWYQRINACGALFRLMGLTGGSQTTYANIITGVAGAQLQTFHVYQGLWEYLNGANADWTFLATCNLPGGFQNGSKNACTNAEAQNAFYTYAGTIANGIDVQTALLGYLINSNAHATPDVNIPPRTRKMLAGFMATVQGANTYGMCMTTGIGARNTLGILHRDWQGVGGTQPPGITVYGWAGTVYAFGIFNFSTDSPANFTVENPTGTFETTFGTKRIVYPHRQTVPMWEAVPENSYCVQFMEFSGPSQIINMMICALWLHCWDGNTVTT